MVTDLVKEDKTGNSGHRCLKQKALEERMARTCVNQGVDTIKMCLGNVSEVVLVLLTHLHPTFNVCMATDEDVLLLTYLLSQALHCLNVASSGWHQCWTFLKHRVSVGQVSYHMV